MSAVETFYRVRRGGYTRPVGTTLTTAEFEQIKNHKQLLASGYFEIVRQEPKEKRK